MNNNVSTCSAELLRVFGQGQILNSRRERLGMSVAALAARSGVSPATIHRILHGDCRRATLENVARVAEALGVQILFEARLDPEAFKHEQAAKRARRAGGDEEAETTDADPRAIAELLRGTGRKIWKKEKEE